MRNDLLLDVKANLEYGSCRISHAPINAIAVLLLLQLVGLLSSAEISIIWVAYCDLATMKTFAKIGIARSITGLIRCK